MASYIKKVLFGLEPEEIAHLLFQKETILQSTHEEPDSSESERCHYDDQFSPALRILFDQKHSIPKQLYQKKE